MSDEVLIVPVTDSDHVPTGTSGLTRWASGIVSFGSVSVIAASGLAG